MSIIRGHYPLLLNAENLKTQLLNYPYERIQLTHAAQSKIIDLIKAGNSDSVDSVINFCDSMNSPNFAWLHESDRFLIKMIKPDINFLLNFENYVKYLGFSDTFTNINTFYPEGFSKIGYDDDEIFRNCKTTFSSANTGADLSSFLLIYGRNRLNVFLVKDSVNSYLWEFIKIFYPAEDNRQRDRYYY